MQTRAVWVELSDAQLLRQCEIDTYRASGPGGQKRNKTSSAVRLRHAPSGQIVIAEESRSQHQNKARALGRLREALYLHVRNRVSLPLPGAEAANAVEKSLAFVELNGRLPSSRRDPRFWPTAGLALDLLEATQARVRETASFLGHSTGRLIGFLEVHPKVWQQANVIRARYGRKPLTR